MRHLLRGAKGFKLRDGFAFKILEPSPFVWLDCLVDHCTRVHVLSDQAAPLSFDGANVCRLPLLHWLVLRPIVVLKLLLDLLFTVLTIVAHFVIVVIGLNIVAPLVVRIISICLEPP